MDYPPTRDYTVQVLGDGDISGEEDTIYTPGDPSEATVTATDDESLQILTVHTSHPFRQDGEAIMYTFRRTGDISQPLSFIYQGGIRDHGTTSLTDWFSLTGQFAAGQSERTHSYNPNPDNETVDISFPRVFTVRIFGDGGIFGLHRIWRAGNPSAASTVLYDDESTGDGLYLQASYPSAGQVGQTIDIVYQISNQGTQNTGNTITVTNVQHSNSQVDENAPAEPRVTCTAGLLVPGATTSCTATFVLTDTDRENSPLDLVATASDGSKTSNELHTSIRVLRGATVGFTTTDRLLVTEPISGEANAEAVMPVSRAGQLDEEIQVAYTIEPMSTRNRPYPPVEGVDYMDNSATPGVLTFAINETDQNITIDILGDEIEEGKEQFKVTLVPPESVLVEASKRDRIVVIEDLAPLSVSYLPTASIELVSPARIPESAGSVDFAVVLDRVWGRHAQFEVSLDAHDNLTATPANARLGQTGDFEPPNGLIHATIPAGETRYEFSLTLYDDDVREDDETFQMLLSSSVPQYHRVIGDNNKVLVTITDDDLVAPAGVELALTRNNRAFDSVAEDSSRRDITVSASFPDIRWPTDDPGAPLRPADPRSADTTVRVTFNEPGRHRQPDRHRAIPGGGLSGDVPGSRALRHSHSRGPDQRHDHAAVQAGR